MALRTRLARSVRPCAPWLVAGIVASFLLSLVETAMIVVTVSMASSDAVGLAAAALSIFTLFALVSLVTSIPGALIEKHLTQRLPDPSDLLAIAFGSVILVTGWAVLVFSIEPSVRSFSYRLDILLICAGLAWTTFGLAVTRYGLKPLFGQVITRLPRLGQPRIMLIVLTTGAAFLGMFVAHAALGALHQRGAASLSGVLALTSLIVGTRLCLGNLGPLAVAASGTTLLLAIAVGPVWAWKDPHGRFVLFGHSHTAATLGNMVQGFVDFDGDGSAPVWLGGSDCAAFDPGRAPALRETPGDGIDQDCRGGDAPAKGASRPDVRFWDDCRVEIPLSVVLITIDSLRADVIKPGLTPQLLQFARRSLSFERAYAPSTITKASVPSIFSGQAVSDRAAANPLIEPNLDLGISFVQRFQGAGYRTGAFNYLAQQYFRSDFDEVNEQYTDPPPGPAIHDITSASLTNGALEFLERVKGQNFVLWVHYLDAHFPHADPMRKVMASDELHLYQSEVAYVDFHIGRLLVYLERLGRMQNTTIAITADHGEDLAGRGREGHGPDVFEDTIHVPLFLSVPGCRPRTIEEPVSLLQLAPTFGALARVAVPGRPLFPGARSDGVPVVSEAKLARRGAFKRAIMQDHHKLIVDVGHGGRALFDLESDPDETRNLYDFEPALAARMEAAYQRWLDHPGQR